MFTQTVLFTDNSPLSTYCSWLRLLHMNFAIRCNEDAPTKRPKTKHPSLETSQIQNIPLHKVPPITRPDPKTSQLQNVSSPKTTQPQNVPTSKRPKPQNVPGPETSQAPKHPNSKTSQR